MQKGGRQLLYAPRCRRARPERRGAPALFGPARCQQRATLAEDRRRTRGCRPAPTQTKIVLLDRLLGRFARLREPAIVFTEYRDTLLAPTWRLSCDSAVTLHGGMTRDERRDHPAVHERPRRVLLATDAAGEGLNLQQRCRLVVNLELPWNPMRLEQRVPDASIESANAACTPSI